MYKLALLAVLLLAGCHVTAATPALAPGAVDSVDDAANKALQPAHAFALSLTKSVQGGTIRLTDSQLLSLNSLNAALNTADAAEIAYHNAGGGNASILTSAVAAAQAALLNAQAIFNSLTK